MTELVLDCEAVAERGLVERYVARTLGEEDTRAFEIHYLECARCQEDIRLASAVRGEILAPRQVRSSRLPFGAIGLGLAAALVAVLTFPRSSVRDPLSRLGALSEAPVYLGVPIRSEEGDAAFEEGMAAYARRDYPRAAEELALIRGTDSIPAIFFRASSLLMLGESDEAAAEFSRLIAAGRSPYLSESHFYRAKAHLLSGRGDEALADLAAAAAGDESIAEQARMLADSVRGIVGR